MTARSPSSHRTSSRSSARRGVRAAAAATALAAVLALAPAPVATAQGEPGDPLDQTIEADLPVVDGPAVLTRGHVDLGPRFVDGEWALLVHDDSEVPTVWRRLDDTVLRVRDAAVRAVPDDTTYSFLGVDPGTDVHVVPQVEHPEVVWLGWNTQDPEVMASIDRGTTLTLLGVQGPGELIVYLQAGNLTEPDVLWRSTAPARQPLWVEVNTHTHANWVFTEPGPYLVQIELTADLVTGDAVRAVGTLRFAVGDGTDPEVARADRFTAPTLPDAAAAGADRAAEQGGAGDDDGGSGLAPIAVVVGLAALALLGGVVAMSVRGAGARRRAEQERQAAMAATGDGESW